MLSATAALSLAVVTSASAQVYVADPYAAPAYVAPLVYAAPAPVVVAPPAYVAAAPIGGYVTPKYSYTVNSPSYGTTYAAYRGLGTCFVEVDGFRTCD
jgi:hypothetical protein